MAQHPETRFVATIHRRLLPYAGQLEIVRRNNPFQRGKPDYLYLRPNGPNVHVEYKVAPNTASMLQLATIGDLRARGFKTAIITKHPNHVAINCGYETICDPLHWLLRELDIEPTP